MIGDEGSGYWIAWTALKTLIDHDDGFSKCEYSLDYVRQSMKEYFEVSTNLDMLTHLYTKFAKHAIAKFTIKLVEGADKGDALCLDVFKKAGHALAKHIIAVCTKSSSEKFPAGLTVVCVGSVWKSYKYLKDSFESTLQSVVKDFNGVTLKQLRKNGAIGAAIVGARDTGYNVPIDYDKHTETMSILA
ncbi:NAGK [Bugula neritina]|uniref:N-acetyl-D-glucosamine kinase n=1 Tax=Bugula neritina TaxID=10212 RepID=A0A7J7JZ03_BUGNE|nr:NAGK [Bugula neritina]